MNKGDKVRFLHGKESGIVTKILDRGLVEVEIEDGFSIPVMSKELVVVSQDESSAFVGGQPATVKAPEKTKAATHHQLKEGYHIVIIPLNDKLHSIYLISSYNHDSLVLVNETNAKSEEKTILSEKLFADSYIKLTERNIDLLNTWPTITLTILKENNKWNIAAKPEKILVNIKAKHFKAGMSQIDKLNKKGYLVSLEAAKHESVQTEVIDTEKIKNTMFEAKSESTSYAVSQTKENYPEVDLHIEALRKDHDSIPKDQILSIQLQEFEQKLNRAIMAGQDEIIFIHGVGNGILKNKIHKYLSQSDNIKFFKDAHKEKFGYGATLIRIN